MELTLAQLAYRALPRVAPGRALADSEWRTLRAAAEVLLADAQPGVGADRAADNVERFLCNGRSRLAWRVRGLLTLLEYLTVPSFGAPFSRLSFEVRGQVVEDRLMCGGLLWRQCAKVRLLVIMGAYGDSRAEVSMGFLPVAQRARFRRKNARPREQPSAEVSAAT